MKRNYYKIVKVLIISFFMTIPNAQAQDVLNVYNWSNAITQGVLDQFTKETGIKVNHDVYDSPDMMEVKMLAGNSGYDVVFLTVAPDLERQSPLKIYQPLDKSKLKNYNLLDKQIMDSMTVSDPGNTYSIPYLWGTTGFGYNKTLVDKLMPDAPTDSLAMIFDPQVAAKLSSCGIVLLDSPVDVFSAALTYLGKDPTFSNVDDLKEASKVVSSMKDYVRRFQASIPPSDLASGNVCVTQGWSGNVMQSISIADELKNGNEIVYVIPKEGAYLWIDAMAIPSDAPHPDLAHKFIDFLIRPDIIAQVTNALGTANAIPAALPFIKDEIKNNKGIYPTPEVMKTFHVDKVHGPSYERKRSREWTRVKTGY